MQIIPYFGFNGNAAEAANIYKEALGGGKLQILKYDDQPQTLVQHPGMEGKVLHGELVVKEQVFYFSDVPKSMATVPGTAIEININFDSLEEIEKAYEVFSQRGIIRQELQDTFWNAKYASVTDEYGNGWSLNYSYPTE